VLAGSERDEKSSGGVCTCEGVKQEKCIRTGARIRLERGGNCKGKYEGEIGLRQR